MAALLTAELTVRLKTSRFVRMAAMHLFLGLNRNFKMQSGVINAARSIFFTKQSTLEAYKHTKAHTNILFYGADR